MRYATETSVSVSRSRAEIEDMVQRAGGAAFGSILQDARAVVLFELAQRRVMFELPLPAKDAFAMRLVRGRKVRSSPEQQTAGWEQACRTRWRALALAIKAKLVSVESGVESFEEAFLAHLVVPGKDGGAARFSSVALPAITEAYARGQLPPLLPSGGTP